ncbi:solute carrier family 13 member 1-like [Gordionus sp. m RMFG-2023]|uniref:solute carrier family 13 member 1-like n=1 Tax=Gordionus sp. m RMFG-2023 TaxID=3053472 RepID=UPI0031FCDE1A
MMEFDSIQQRIEAKGQHSIVHLLKSALKRFMKIKNFYISLLIPIIFSPLIISYNTKEIRCAYVCLVTIGFLVSQALPLALSSLIPALLFPMFGILNVKDVSSMYFQDPILLFFASVILAKGIQSTNLHKRIALNMLMHSGSKPIWMVLGFIMSTFFISIWINNSATAVLMTPVAIGVMEEFHKFKKVSVITKAKTISKHELFNEKENEQTVVIINDVKDKEDLIDSDSSTSLSKHDDDKLQNLRKCIFIGIAYACNIGGTASLTGTPPNLIMTGFLTVLFGAKAEISFVTWFLYSFPGALIIIILTWMQLCFYFIGFKETFRQMGNKKSTEDPRSFIREQLNKLGKFRQNEITILCLFITLVGLWIFKNPKFIPGWLIFFEKNYVSDATPALLIALLLFILPCDFRSVLMIKDNSGEIPDYQPLLIWKDIYHDLMWDINLLLGGGLAMAAGFKASGLSRYLVRSFDILRIFPHQLLVITFSTFTSLITEVLNNIATASIMLPIISEIAVSIKVNPLYFMFPVTLAASYCFMLPIGTAPNAIVFSAGKLKFLDMV